jgi:hypothetical protein
MEPQENFEKQLTEKMSAQASDITAPPLSRMNAARKIVAQRAGQSPQGEDLLTLLAGFLNMKIRLYHAVLATIIIAGLIFFFSKEDNKPSREAIGHTYESNIAAVNHSAIPSGISVSNSTVLSSINTFIIRK